MDYLAIRERSVHKLARWKLPDPGVLPLHSDADFDWIRDARDVAARCHAIAAALALQQGAPPKRIRARARRQRPRALARASASCASCATSSASSRWTAEELHQTSVDISWREEALWALMWSIELVDDLPPTSSATASRSTSASRRTSIPPKGRTDVALRPLAELAAMLDFYYCLHWHARNAQYHGQMWDPEIAPGVVLERRRALEWLFQDVPWEDVDLGA